MSVDLMSVKPGVTIVTKDGAKLIVRGSYMSSDGLMFTARANDKQKIDRNVPASDVISVSAGE